MKSWINKGHEYLHIFCSAQYGLWLRHYLSLFSGFKALRDQMIAGLKTQRLFVKYAFTNVAFEQSFQNQVQI